MHWFSWHNIWWQLVSTWRKSGWIITPSARWSIHHWANLLAQAFSNPKSSNDLLPRSPGRALEVHPDEVFPHEVFHGSQRNRHRQWPQCWKDRCNYVTLALQRSWPWNIEYRTRQLAELIPEGNWFVRSSNNKLIINRVKCKLTYSISDQFPPGKLGMIDSTNEAYVELDQILEVVSNLTPNVLRATWSK